MLELVLSSSSARYRGSHCVCRCWNGTDSRPKLPGESASADILDRLELDLVDALLVGLLARDLPRVQQLLDRGVHGAHAELGAGLHHVLELIELALADEVGRRGSVDKDLERSDAAVLVRLLQQLLRDHAA